MTTYCIVVRAKPGPTVDPDDTTRVLGPFQELEAAIAYQAVLSRELDLSYDDTELQELTDPDDMGTVLEFLRPRHN